MSPDTIPVAPTPNDLNSLSWQSLSLLKFRLTANCNALAKNNPTLASQLLHFIPPTPNLLLAVKGNDLLLAQVENNSAQILPCQITAASAHQLLKQVFPTGKMTESLLIAGVDQGWLWQLAYTMPIHNPAIAGFRPPLYFLVKNIQELWLAFHIHDWQTMLADTRIRLFAGSDPASDFYAALLATPEKPWPRTALTIDQSIWPQPNGFEPLVQKAQSQIAAELQNILDHYPQTYAWATPEALASKLHPNSGQKLRILGITSRYTTFLQYSMRDWLAGMARLGHETRLQIEENDHEVLTPICFARACADFKPDLILLIDHYRKEFCTLPPQVPCAMWVQDRLPNIFTPEAGPAQTDRDFCLGFGRLHLSSRFGYPPQRYLSCTMGVNDARYTTDHISPSDLARFSCDASFVSHASTPADQLLSQLIQQQPNDALLHRLLKDIYERMVAHYESTAPSGGWALSDPAIRLIIQAAQTQQNLQLPSDTIDSLVVFFNQQISNALFRHQTLHWFAALDIDFRLYGKGWENHPELSKWARGVANNNTELHLIYRASKINIQVTPHGTVHQRLLDGLAAGAFFLLRWHPGDTVGLHFKKLWEWCQQNHIADQATLEARATPEIHKLLSEIDLLEGAPCPPRKTTHYDIMLGHLDSDFMTSAASIWPEYDQIAFRNTQELHAMVSRFLTNEPLRQTITASMRTAMLDRSSYLGISKRLLQLIARELPHPNGSSHV